LRDNRDHLAQLTKDVYPNYNRGFYKTYHNQYESPSSQQGMRMQAATRVTSNAGTLFRVINTLPISEDASVESSVIQELKSKGYTNNPKYGELNEALRAWAVESVATQGRGQAPVSFVKQLMNGLPATASKANFRAVVRDGMIGTENIVNAANQGFKTDSGLNRNAPLLTDDTLERFNAIARMNPYTGIFPPDAPEELRIVGADVVEDPKQRTARPRWMTSDEEWKPLTRENYFKYLNWLKANPSDPRAPKIRHELGIIGDVPP
jgi:hypothetical protein